MAPISSSQYQNEGHTNIYGGNAIWIRYVLSIFRKIAIVSDVFKGMERSFQIVAAATEKARLPKLSFVFGTISCCEIDYLSYL